MMSLPRALSVEDDDLRIDVPPEVRAVTAPDAEAADVDLAPGAGYRIDGADGDCLEVDAEIDLGDAASMGLTLCRSPDGEERTTVAGTGTSWFSGSTEPAPAWTRKSAAAYTTRGWPLLRARRSR